MASLMKATPDPRRIVTDMRETRMVIDADERGFLRRVIVDVQLDKGPDLYQAKGGSPYQIWGRGPSKVVAAMGGELFWLPRIQNIDGDWEDGFKVNRDKWGAIRSVEAWAMCKVRHPMTGTWTVAVDRATEDMESMLRQELAKISRPSGDSAQQSVIITTHAKGVQKAEDGWLVLPYTVGGMVLCANPEHPAVIGALRAHDKLCDVKVLEGRIKSKAMRRAFLANGVTRACGSFLPGDLRQKRDADGNPISALCVVIPVPCWIEHEHREDVQSYLINVSEGQQPMALLPAPEDEIDMGAYDEDTDDDQPVREPLAQAVRAETKPAPTRKPPAEVKQATKPEPVAGPVDPERYDQLVIACEEFEADLDDVEIAEVRETVGLDTNPLDAQQPSVDVLERYLAALRVTITGGAS